jgi:uncharacterized protein YbbK (DUF523 family)
VIRIAVSSCLLGEKVRWDGGDKREPAVADVLAREFEIVAVCPEVEIGLGVPREPVDVALGRLVGKTSGTDHTDAMRALAAARAIELGRRISGWVFKSASPSCGLDRGVFATAVVAVLPGLPVAEETSLRDPEALVSFVARVRAWGEEK